MADFMKKPIVKKILLLLVIAVVAVAAEFCYVAVTRSDLEYRRAEFSAEDFSSWEIETRENGEYYMLAYNSYFEKNDFGGVPVQTIEIMFTRAGDDSTEMVLYYKGTKGGIYGEFPAAITKVSDGVYSATVEIESLESIKIYPTERVRSVITFGGVVLNPDVTTQTFTAARIILWAILTALIYVLYNIFSGVLKKKIKLPRFIEFSAWTNVYVILAAVVMFAVFQATRMFSGVGGAAGMLLPAAFCGFTAVYLTIWLIVKKIEKIETKVAVTVLAVGIIFSFANAPLQTPDEQQHFMRSYAIAQGDFGFDIGHVFPDDVYHLADTFPGEFHNNTLKTRKGTTISSIREYFENKNTQYSGRKYITSMQIVVPYLPAAVGIALTRAVGGDALACLYAARLCNIAVFAVCAYFALKMAVRYRGALIAMILMPLTLFMAASTSYDSMLLACVVLFFGFVLKKEIRLRDMIGIIAVFSVIVCIKPVYIPLALFILLIPKEAVKTKVSRWVILIAIAAALAANEGTLLYASLFGNVPPETKLAGVDVAAQISYVLGNPIRYLMVLAVDAYQKVFYLTNFGIFGWLDVETALTGFVTPIVFVVVGALYADEVKLYKKSDKWINIAALVLIYVVVVTGFYAAWSTLGSTDILGVQARYFIPILPGLIAVLSTVLSPVVRFDVPAKERELTRDKICVYICAAAAFIGAAELLLNYFIM